MLFAPGRFSTMTGWPSDSESLGAMRRAVTSTALPGPVGTIQRSGFAGYGCANTDAASNSPDSASTVFIVLNLPLEEVADFLVETRRVLDVGDMRRLRHRAVLRARD